MMALNKWDGVKFAPFVEHRLTDEELYAQVGKRFLTRWNNAGELIAADVSSLTLEQKAKLVPFMKVVSD